MNTPCKACPLRARKCFLPMTAGEVNFMDTFKTAELKAQPGTEILSEDASSAQIYTALSGMGLRYKTMRDGNRQVVGFVLPGDFIGLQTGVMDVMRHSAEATTRMDLCVFNRSDLWRLFETHPERAFDLTYLAASEEHLVGEALVAVGQMEAIEKIAWALSRFYSRLTALGLNRNGRVPLPYRQQDLADALGLSLVHTNKTLARLRQQGLATWSGNRLTVLEPEALAELGHTDLEMRPRPLI